MGGWRVSRAGARRPASSRLHGGQGREGRATAYPRVRYHVECHLEEAKWFGDEVVIFLGVVAASVDRDAPSAADPCAVLRPIFFLEPDTFGTITSSSRLG